MGVRSLCVIIFPLGFCLLLLAEVAEATRGYGTLLGLAGSVVGGLTVVGSLLVFMLRRGGTLGSS